MPAPFPSLRVATKNLLALLNTGLSDAWGEPRLLLLVPGHADRQHRAPGNRFEHQGTGRIPGAHRRDDECPAAKRRQARSRRAADELRYGGKG